MFKKFYVVIACILSSTTNLYAEVITDSTWGRETTTLSGHFQISDQLGQQMGGNLFHSFKVFNVNTGESATFTGPNSVENIITRVTGGSQSFIDGTLSSDIQGANLYLLNPSGILFDEHASLNLTGSFHASTADSVRFKDGTSFSASMSQNPILTIEPPEAFGFLDNPAPISIQDSHLEIGEHETLSIIGGDLEITDSTLLSPGGQINLVAVAQAGEIIPTSLDKVMESFEKLGKITLSEHNFLGRMQQQGYANVDVSGEGGGHVFIRAGQFLMESSSIFADNTHGNQDGLGIDIAVQGNMRLAKSARITAGAGNIGKNKSGGNITIKAGKLELSGLNSGFVLWFVSSFHPDNPKQPTPEMLTERFNINPQKSADLVEKLKVIAAEINPTAEVSLDMILDKIGVQDTNLLFKGIFNHIGTSNFGAGIGGNIQIETPILTISKGSVIDTTTYSNGNAGNIDILNAQKIMLQDNGFIRAATVEDGSGKIFGKAGTITINIADNPADDILLENFSSISVGSVSFGDAGDIKLTTDNLTLNKGSIISYNRGTGNAGEISLTTDTASLTNGSKITTEATHAGGGNINLQIADELDVEGSRISAEAKGTEPHHHGGNLKIKATKIFTLDNSSLLANAHAGNGGKIDIETEEFNVLGDVRIDVSSELGFTGEFWLNRIKMSDLEALFDDKKYLELNLADNRCDALSREDFSSFFVITRDVPPESPFGLKTP